MKLNAIKLFIITSLLALCLCACGNQSGDKTNKAQQNNNENTVTVEAGTSSEDIIKEPAPLITTSFIGCGDNIIYGTKEAVIKAEPGGRKYNYKPYYESCHQIIEQADIAFINQETVMCGDGYSLSWYPRFNSPQEVGYDLVEMGFDVINIATNHMLDKGADGLDATIDFWNSFDNVLMIGGYKDGEDFDNIRIYEKDGLKIAFLSYTYSTNGLSKASSSPIVIPYINEEDIIRQAELAKQKADMVFVSVHWGQEGSFTPSTEQMRVAQLFADCGIDCIIGHHPHVIQPVKWLTGKDGNSTLCVYSLGNFMAQQAYDYNMVGGIISFDIIHSEDIEPYLDNVLFTPTVYHFNSAFTNNNVYPMELYPKELAPQHGVRGYYGHRFEYDKLIEYVTDTVDLEFLPDFFKTEEE